jgi:hypothetical protein
MSSVSSAGGRSDQNDEIRRLREEYRKKEAELIKRQNKELAKVNQAHETEMEKSEKQQNQDLNETREKTKEVITQKDAKFQKEIEDMRALQTKQLERLTQDNAAKVEAQRQASTGEVTDEKLARTDHEKDLMNKYEQGNRATEDKFSNELQKLRDDERGALVEQKASQIKEQQKELEGMREERNERVANLENQNREMYQNTTQRLRDQEVQHSRDKQRIEDNGLATLKKAQVADGRTLETERTGYQDSLRKTKNDFGRKRENDMIMGEEERAKFHDDVNSRIDGQVNRLSKELSQANDRGVLAETTAQAKAQREIDDMRNAYQANVDSLERERRGILDQTNDRVGQKVKAVHAETDKQMATNTKYYLNQMQTENFKDRAARDQLVQDFSERQKYQEDQSRGRIDKVRSESVTNENELRGTFQSDLDMQKSGFDEKKKDIIMTSEKDKNSSINRLHDQAEKQEMEHQALLNTVVDKYEKRVADLNDQLIRERRLNDNHSKVVVKDLTRERETDIENLKMKYEERAKQMEVAHQQEMKELNRRQQEKLDEVLTSVRKQS